jgi:hypothetical protein
VPAYDADGCRRKEQETVQIDVAIIFIIAIFIIAALALGPANQNRKS